jgi:hypothetical protein
MTEQDQGARYGRYAGPADPDQTQQYPQQQPQPLREDGNRQPDGTPQYTSNGFTQAERNARTVGQKGNLKNWFTTGDAKLDPNSEEGRKLAPAIPDGWSVASLITAFFVPLAGLVLSIVAFADAKKNHRRVHGTAVGGFAVGLLGSIAWTLYWVVVIVAMAALTNAVNSNPYGG